jgi:predicted N-formylglutamate amidohydrolase
MAEHPPLLAPEEPPPFVIDNPNGRSRFFLTCDHASNRMPRALGDLGLHPEQMELHVAYDVGAQVMAQRMSERLDATLIRTCYSRLALDPNRPPGSPGSIPVQSELTRVPGNEGIDEAERRRREDTLFHPYHEALGRLLDDRLARGIVPIYIAVHSFTPVYFGEARHVEVCVSWRTDDRLGRLMHGALDGLGRWKVVAHDPFIITLQGDWGVPYQGEGRGLPSVLLEVRQDFIGSDEDARAWGDRLADAMAPLEDDPSIRARIAPPDDLPEGHRRNG